jgi:hypothetical protein
MKITGNEHTTNHTTRRQTNLLQDGIGHCLKGELQIALRRGGKGIGNVVQ